MIIPMAGYTILMLTAAMRKVEVFFTPTRMGWWASSSNSSMKWVLVMRQEEDSEAKRNGKANLRAWQYSPVWWSSGKTKNKKSTVKSACLGAYYAGPGNRFWPTLHRVGLTLHGLAPGEFRSVLRYGIGFTDLNKAESGPDAGLSATADSAAVLEAEIARHRPAFLAFNGKRAGRVFLGLHAVGYGIQTRRIGDTVLHMLPSTSGAASGW